MFINCSVKRLFFFTSIFAGFFLQGCSEEQTTSSQQTSLQAIEPCSEDSRLTAWCGYKNAEDLVATPDGRFLLATGFGGLPDSYINEMMIIDFAEKIKRRLPDTIQLHSLKLQETATSYAQWYASDNE